MSINLKSQNRPKMLWDKSLGGSGFENLMAMIPTADGGYLLGGISDSPKSCEKSENFRPNNINNSWDDNYDYWVIKVDALGSKVWDKTFGGSYRDYLLSIAPAQDGGFLLAGWSASPKSFDKSDNNKERYDNNDNWGGYDYYDYWVVKIDANGNKLWDKTIGSSTSDFLHSAIATQDGGFLLGGLTYSSYIDYDKTDSKQGFWVVKIDANGKKIWDKVLDYSTRDNFLKSLLETPNGDFLIGVSDYFPFNQVGSPNLPSLSSNYDIIKIDAQGNQIWSKTYGGENAEALSTIIKTQDNHYLLAGISASTASDQKSDPSRGDWDYWLVKIDEDGNRIWDKTFGGEKREYMPDVCQTPDGGFIIGGTTDTWNISGDKTEKSNTFINIESYSSYTQQDYWVIKTDVNGNKLWDKTLGAPGQDVLSKVYALSNTSFMLGGYSHSGTNDPPYYPSDKTDAVCGFPLSGGHDIWLIKLEADKLNPKIVSGSVFNDLNNNCKADAEESKLLGWYIRAEPGSHYALTDINGNYSIALDTGRYEITQIPPPQQAHLFEKQICPTKSHLLQITPTSRDTSNLNFANQMKPCHSLTVDVSTHRLLRCFTGETKITYQNQGIINAQNASIQVIIPKYLIPLRSSIPWSHRKDSLLIFNVGDLKPNQINFIVISDSVACAPFEEVNNLTQCVKAVIFPKNNCFDLNPEWDKADLAIFSQCLNNQTSRFIIKNIGEGNMRKASHYTLFIDDSLLVKSTIQLDRNDSLTLDLPYESASLRLEVEQSLFHPYNSLIISALDNCMSSKQKAFRSYINHFVQVKDELGIAIDCNDILGSFDPNDKLAQPIGFTDKHYISKDSWINYTIRFQNTGSAEAINVMVVDTLNEYLNFETFQILSVSHPYKLILKSNNGKQTLAWRFDNINLPDSSTNVAESEGYIKFKIKPKQNLALETKITNFADIYFDYNEPIRTNTVKHTIGNPKLPQSSNDECRITGFAPASPSILCELKVNLV
jgi:uncharacterized repeat protein (TIGR01451 family)